VRAIEKSEIVLTDTARSLYEEQFIADHIARQGRGLDLQEANRRAVTALLATGHQPSQFLLKLMTGELKHYWSADPMERKRSHRKRLAAAVAREIAALAERLAQQDVSDPITQAQDKVAQRWGYASGKSLNKWLRRNR
jgi:hypothetical protein